MTNLRVLVFGLALITAAPVCCQGQSLSPPETVVVQSGALKLRGLLWWPAGRRPFSAVLFNHGSGSLPDPKQPAILGPVFARHGYAFLYLFRRGAGLSSDQGTNSGTLMARALAEKGQEARNELQLQLQGGRAARRYGRSRILACSPRCRWRSRRDCGPFVQRAAYPASSGAGYWRTCCSDFCSSRCILGQVTRTA